MADFPRPETAVELHGFLGVRYFYRRCIPRGAAILAPLNYLLKCLTAKDKNFRLVWTQELEAAFQSIKTALHNTHLRSKATHCFCCHLVLSMFSGKPLLYIFYRSSAMTDACNNRKLTTSCNTKLMKRTDEIVENFACKYAFDTRSSETRRRSPSRSTTNSIIYSETPDWQTATASVWDFHRKRRVLSPTTLRRRAFDT